MSIPAWTKMLQMFIWTLTIEGSWRIRKIYHKYRVENIRNQNSAFHANWSCMICQNLFSGENKKTKIEMSSAENITQHAKRLTSADLVFAARLYQI